MLLQFVIILVLYVKKIKWQIVGPNQNNFKLFCVLFKSSTHTGLICVKNSASNISCLGPFKIFYNDDLSFTPLRFPLRVYHMETFRYTRVGRRLQWLLMMG
jgi:hypothetical protein